MVDIGIIGEHDPGNETHVATDDALGHAATALGTSVDVTWLSTADVPATAPGPFLERFGGLLVAPGSPYRSLTGALAAIEHARAKAVPLLGTCAGLQHVVVELARNVLGVADAQHAEYDPESSTLFVTPLSCSLVGQAMTVDVRPGTRAAEAYRSPTVTERYYCNFGINPAHLDDLVSAGLRVTGTDEAGEARIVELPDLPFFVATLFVPQATSSLVRPHPLVTAFLRAAAAHSSPSSS
jgi:CTP synthase (UTP-ammonia lyase)